MANDAVFIALNDGTSHILLNNGTDAWLFSETPSNDFILPFTDVLRNVRARIAHRTRVAQIASGNNFVYAQSLAGTGNVVNWTEGLVFSKTLIFQSLAFVCPVPPPDIPAWEVTTAIIFDKTIIYQDEANVVEFAQAEEVTVDKWFKWLDEPVRFRRFITALQQDLALVKADPFPEEVTESRWHQPWSNPQKLNKVGLGTANQLAFVYGAPLPSIGVDLEWFARLTEPVRLQPRLRTGIQQELAFVKADPFPEAVTVDRWLQPLGQFPGKKKSVVWQQDLAIGYPPIEVVESDKWFVPLSDPVRLKIGLKTALQQYLALVKADPFPESVTEDRWHQPFSNPQKLNKVGLGTANQQAFTYGAPLPSIGTELEWFARLTEPVRLKPGLKANLQQFLALVKADPFPEAVTIDRWLLGLSEPYFRKPHTHQQALAQGWLDVPAAATVSFQQPDTTAIFVKKRLYMVQSALVKADPFGETVLADKWFVSLTQPKRERFGLKAPFQQVIATVPFEERSFVTLDKWFVQFTQPKRDKFGLRERFQQVLASVPFDERNFVTLDKWFAELRQPKRERFGLKTQFQQVLAAVPFDERQFITLDKWFAEFRQPKRDKFGLKPLYHQSLALTQAAPFGEAIFPDKWFTEFTQPKRQPFGGKYYQQRETNWFSGTITFQRRATTQGYIIA